MFSVDTTSANSGGSHMLGEVLGSHSFCFCLCSVLRLRHVWRTRVEKRLGVGKCVNVKEGM